MADPLDPAAVEREAVVRPGERWYRALTNDQHIRDAMNNLAREMTIAPPQDSIAARSRLLGFVSDIAVRIKRLDHLKDRHDDR